MKAFISVSLALLPALASAKQYKRQDATTSSAAPPAPTPPSQDPWYSPPADFETAAPGTVLKFRDVTPEAAFAPLKNYSNAYNLLYATRDSRGLPTWTVTLLLTPVGWNQSCKDKLITYGFPQDDNKLDNAPSYAVLAQNSLFGNDDVYAALTNGWAINIPDYEGPLSSFTSGRISGQAILDATRAVFNYPALGIRERYTTYALWGYSGGSIATEWASELVNTYAPELDFAGAAIGGTIANLSATLNFINAGFYAGVGAAGINGIATQFPDLQAYVDSELKTDGDFNATVFKSTNQFDLIDLVFAFLSQDLGQYFKSGQAALQAPIAQSGINSDGIMGLHGVPDYPLFFFHAAGDMATPISGVDDLVAKYCKAGAIIEYERRIDELGDHLPEFVSGRVGALNFLNRILTGTFTTTGCTTTNVTVPPPE